MPATPPAAARLLAEARAVIGMVEEPPGSNVCALTREWGPPDGQPWCDRAVSVLARRAGIPETVIPRSQWVPGRWRHAVSRGWTTDDPQPGDLVVYDWTPHDGVVGDHIGIVEHVDGPWITTIEGNTSPGSTGSQADGDGVWRRRRPRAAARGFIRPPWPEQEEPMPTAAEVADAILTDQRLTDLLERAALRGVWQARWPAPIPGDPDRTESAGDRLVQAARGHGTTGGLEAILALLRGGASTAGGGAVDVDRLADAIVDRLVGRLGGGR